MFLLLQYIFKWQYTVGLEMELELEPESSPFIFR